MILLALWTIQLILTRGLTLWCVSDNNKLLAIANAGMFLIGICGWIMAWSIWREQPSTHV